MNIHSRLGVTGQKNMSVGRVREGSMRHVSRDYDNNALMKRVIEAHRAHFLKDPALGFRVDNIKVAAFRKHPFTYGTAEGRGKSFTGETLLMSRGFELNIAGIVKLLGELGIEVAGKVKVKRKNHPTEQEFQDNALMKRVIMAHQVQILRRPERGFKVDNIKVVIFVAWNFTCVEGGKRMRFGGKTLLEKRGFQQNISGIVGLLRELGIEVEGEIRVEPTEEEYANDTLMRRVIMSHQAHILRDPTQGFVAENISSAGFRQDPSYTFTTPDGERRSFTGQTLLKRRGCSRDIPGIMELLKQLGITD